MSLSHSPTSSLVHKRGLLLHPIQDNRYLPVRLYQLRITASYLSSVPTHATISDLLTSDSTVTPQEPYNPVCNLNCKSSLQIYLTMILKINSQNQLSKSWSNPPADSNAEHIHIPVVGGLSSRESNTTYFSAPICIFVGKKETLEAIMVGTHE